ncbi:MAG TPA: tetratricopeptide repeat protein [Vicinamibacterales bacterium]|nr:tetratricopeptide repeat protein [Vicinamibacterales bacterium]
MRRATIAAVAFAAAAAGACRRDPIALGDRYLAAGQAEEAILEYRTAARAQPTRVDVLEKLATAFDQGGHRADAIAALADAAKLAPSRVDLLTRAGWLALAAGRVADAHVWKSDALRRDRTNVDALLLAGSALADFRAYPAALSAADALAAEDPVKADALRGMVQFRRGDVNAARDALTHAVALAPSNADAQLLLASIERAAGEAAAADRRLASVAADPAAAWKAHVVRAQWLAREQRGDDAVAEAKAAIAQRPRAPQGQAALGAAEAARGHWSDAIAADGRAVELAPLDEHARLALVDALLAHGDARDAVHAAQPLAELWPGPATFIVLARTMRRADDVDGARRVLAESDHTSPGDPNANAEIGDLELAAGRLDAAEDRTASAVGRLERAAAAAPDRTDVRELLADVLLATGQRDRARRELEWAAAHDADGTAPLTTLAMLERADGRIDAAERGRLDRALELAQIAERALGSRAEVLDTFGWIYLKQHRALDAQRTFSRAIDLAPHSRVYREHLARATHWFLAVEW